MSTIDEIKSAIYHLSHRDLELFRAWFYEYEGNVWDAELEEDVQSGKLDAHAEQATRDFEEGRCTDL
jgi:hypothetical protein